MIFISMTAPGSVLRSGNAVFSDTVQNLTLISNLMVANKKANSFLATQKPTDHSETGQGFHLYYRRYCFFCEYP